MLSNQALDNAPGDPCSRHALNSLGGRNIERAVAHTAQRTENITSVGERLDGGVAKCTARSSLFHELDLEDFGGVADRQRAYNNALITLKMVVLAPMPRASVSTATIEKPGDFRSVRAAKRKSCQHVSTTNSHPADATASAAISRLPGPTGPALQHPFVHSCPHLFLSCHFQICPELCIQLPVTCPFEKGSAARFQGFATRT